MTKSKPIPAELPQPESIDIQSIASQLIGGILDLVCVLGPTASGKTRYAVQLACKLRELCKRPVEIISADSRQIYIGMDIGTGKDLAEYGDVPYHLIDILPAGEKYNVHDYVEAFKQAYSDIKARGAFAILCGGTGLYINAVTSAYDFSTSKPLSETGNAHSVRPEGLPSNTFFIGTLVSREVRNERIDKRLRARLEEGMVEEIRTLLSSGISAEDLIYYGLEYKFVTQYVIGEISYDEMVAKLSIAIHQFAKRQMTWFRGMERSGVQIHWTELG